MSRTLRSWIIAIVIIIILLIPIYVDYYKNSHIETIKSYSSYSELVNKNSFAVIYRVSNIIQSANLLHFFVWFTTKCV